MPLITINCSLVAVFRFNKPPRSPVLLRVVEAGRDEVGLVTLASAEVRGTVNVVDAAETVPENSSGSVGSVVTAGSDSSAAADDVVSSGKCGFTGCG